MLEIRGLNKSYGGTARARRRRLRRAPRAASPASSAATAPARPPRCASCSACSPPTRGTVTLDGAPLGAGRPPPLRLHARRARALPEDEAARADRVPRPPARHSKADAAGDATDAARAARPRRAPRRQRRDALARQPAARADRRRARARPRGAHPRRAVLGPRPDRRRRRRRACCSDRAAAGVPVLFSSHQLDSSSGSATTSSSSPTARSARPARARTLRARARALRFELLAGDDPAGCATSRASRSSTSTAATPLFDADADETAQRVLQRRRRPGDVASFAPQRPSLAQIFKEVIQ